MSDPFAPFVASGTRVRVALGYGEVQSGRVTLTPGGQYLLNRAGETFLIVPDEDRIVAVQRGQEYVSVVPLMEERTWE